MLEKEDKRRKTQADPYTNLSSFLANEEWARRNDVDTYMASFMAIDTPIESVPALRVRKLCMRSCRNLIKIFLLLQSEELLHGVL